MNLTQQSGMRVWLINPYGPIPGEGWREYRYTMIGEALAARGHEVVWWTANFSHHFKRFRSPGWRDVRVSDGFTIRLAPTVGYRRNIGLGRVAFELVYWGRVWRALRRAEKPDVIVCVNPPQTICASVVRFAHRRQIPVIVDVFDLWPELFILAVPQSMRFLAGAVFAPWAWLRRYSLSRASAVAAVSEDYLEVARTSVQGSLRSAEVVYIGVDVTAVRAQRMPMADAREFGRALGKAPGALWAIYPGTLGSNYDIHTLLECASLLQRRRAPVAILIAGDGPLAQHVAAAARATGASHLRFLGRLDPATLAKYYQVCDVGLSPYLGESTVSMPTKVYDFLAAGLPIVNSLPGEVARRLAQDGAGVSYASGDAGSLADALQSLAADRPRLAGMADNAWKAAMHFDKAAQYAHFSDLVERAGRPAAARSAER